MGMERKMEVNFMIVQFLIKKGKKKASLRTGQPL